tara:strand:+ start:150 stop:800 length:651 start_codon:yes stop_codon:yes gene_type:complete
MLVTLSANIVFADEGRLFDFETDRGDKPPAEFTAALTGGGADVKWLVKEVSAPPSGRQVVAQLSADKTNRRYPILIHNGIYARDLDLSVKFKTISGEVDASGGLIFRYQDIGNYYVVRANSLEDNVVAYKTEDGRRNSTGVEGRRNSYGVDVSVPHQTWNTLSVIVRGKQFQVYLNDRKLFEVSNEVFLEAGQIGLWTKADAVTHFDDLQVRVLDE